MAELIRARDRATGEVGEYTPEFLDAWPGGYFRLAPAEDSKSKKSSVRVASPVPKGTNPEGGV